MCDSLRSYRPIASIANIQLARSDALVRVDRGNHDRFPTTVLIQLQQSAPRATSPSNAASGTSTARTVSPKPPGGPATVMRRKAAADRAEKTANLRPSSTRAAGAGGSSSTMLSKSYPVYALEDAWDERDEARWTVLEMWL
jgi:hypothetical protein